MLQGEANPKISVGLLRIHPALMPDTKRVDRAEIARHVERAEKLLQKGKTADALEEYMQVLAQDSHNDTVRQMAADLCLSLQRIPDAVRLLGELFERQMAAGDAMRASLTYKKLARFANPSCEQKIRFGQLLEIASEFGFERVQSEWRYLLGDPTPEVERARAEVERILKNIATRFASASSKD